MSCPLVRTVYKTNVFCIFGNERRHLELQTIGEFIFCDSQKTYKALRQLSSCFLKLVLNSLISHCLDLLQRYQRLCPGVPVHRGNNHCTPLFMNLCLAVEHCWVFCIGSCEPVHEDRTEITCTIIIIPIFYHYGSVILSP